MNNIVQEAVVMYYTPTEQMNNALNTAMKAKAKYDKENQSRHDFLSSVMGKSLYKKCINNGALNTFAPIPFSALKYTADDFLKLQTSNKLENNLGLSKLYQYIETAYPKNMFRVYDNEIRCDIVFNSVDAVIDFFQILLNGINKSYKVKLTAQDINWKPICKKINEYLS